jgi:hypothetical protein
MSWRLGRSGTRVDVTSKSSRTPFYDSPDSVRALRSLIESPEFGRVTDPP